MISREVSLSTATILRGGDASGFARLSRLRAQVVRGDSSMHQPTTDDPLAQRVAATGCPRPILWDFGSISSTCSTPAPRRWAIARADIVHSTREVPLNTAARLNAGDMNVFACLSRLPGPRRTVGYQGRSGSMVDRVRFTLVPLPRRRMRPVRRGPCSTTSTRPAGWPAFSARPDSPPTPGSDRTRYAGCCPRSPSRARSATTGPGPRTSIGSCPAGRSRTHSSTHA